MFDGRRAIVVHFDEVEFGSEARTVIEVHFLTNLDVFEREHADSLNGIA